MASKFLIRRELALLQWLTRCMGSPLPMATKQVEDCFSFPSSLLASYSQLSRSLELAGIHMYSTFVSKEAVAVTKGINYKVLKKKLSRGSLCL